MPNRTGRVLDILLSSRTTVKSALALAFLVVLPVAAAHAETGYDLWLRYVPLSDAGLRNTYRRAVTALLAIVLQPEASNASYDNEIPQHVLFDSGGPMLMVPYIHKGPLDAHHVGIAWDGSRLAARAVRDAMPFLMGAKAVTVIAINEEAGEASSDHLVAHLGRRGIAARVQRLTMDRGNVQGAILSVAAESNMGLLVMGGYGHSRLHERILGGVTRSMFDCMTVPVLMSH